MPVNGQTLVAKVVVDDNINGISNIASDNWRGPLSIDCDDRPVEVSKVVAAVSEIPYRVIRPSTL